MKSFQRSSGLVSLVFVLVLCCSVLAGSQGRGLFGEWDMKLNLDGSEMKSVLTFGRDKEGELRAQWVSIFGIGEVKDIKREGKDITFTLTNDIGDQVYIGNFIGTLEKGVLSGLLSSDSGEIMTEGKKLKRMAPILGSWNMTITMGDREFKTVLVVSQDKEKKLQAEWQSQWGEHKISDVQFKEGKLTFSRISKFGDREWETTYEGKLKGHTLTGTFSSQQGELTANGKRLGAALVGKWDLTMTSDQGTRKQRLTVLPDLSARFGALPIKKIGYEEGKVSFEMSLPFGDNEYEISLEGKFKAGKLTGKLTTTQGTSEVTGIKIRPIRRKK
ncbi:MAG: hypothetical protein GY774_33555 [Planctomycetes bacterium]|nr:hypothetical protein [Planctomycetota bacterium]